MIDLDILDGESFFDRSGITYNKLNSMDNPIKLITDYFLSVGQKAWWLSESTPAAIRLFGDIPKEEQHRLMGYAFSHFPELFSHSSNKFYRFMSWLVTEKSIVDAALRDRFTAGGKVDLCLCGKTYKGVPQIFNRLYIYKEYIRYELYNADLEELSANWGITASVDCKRREGQLIALICRATVDNDELGTDKEQLVTSIFLS